jgi:ATP-dependent RNA helicase DDX49/DBP8
MSLQGSEQVDIFSSTSLLLQKKKRKREGKGKPNGSGRRSSEEPSKDLRKRKGTSKDEKGLRSTKSEESPSSPPSSSSPTSFQNTGLNAWIRSICTSLGMKTATPVQRACIPEILEGRDVVACAETGSGKTACYLLPALQMLARDRFGVFCLVLVPARELAYQSLEQLRGLGGNVVGMKGVAIVGGMSITEQCRELAQKPHFVFATPGRLKDILEHDKNCAQAFKRLKMFVIDEADRILDPAFEEDLKVIGGYLPENRQTLLFSATISQSIEILQEVVMKDCFKWSQHDMFKTVAKVKDQYIFVPEKVKEVYLYYILEQFEEMKVRSAIIFVKTVESCHVLSYLLYELDIVAVALHSKQKQKQRMSSLNKFKSGVCPILVATDVASRGLDIPTVDLVINFDLPKIPREYVHRVGRTARAGRSGRALSFVTQYTVDLLHKIESLIGRKLTNYETHEKQVLKLITRVFAARKAVTLRIEEEEEVEA